MPSGNPEPLRPLRWENDGLSFVDQRYLPHELIIARACRVSDVIAALSASAVTGRRCIDLAAAFGAVLAAASHPPGADRDAAFAALRTASAACGGTSLERVLAAESGNELRVAQAILAENVALDRAIAAHAAALLPPGGAVLTLGSSGALSTGAAGTAATAIIAAHAAGTRIRAFVCETRPLMTGLRLTAFECLRAGVAVTIVADGSAPSVMQSAPIAAVLVAATGMAANGDARGELGTYALAIAAAHHRVPFYVTLPRSAVDRSARTGATLTTARLSAPPVWPQTGELPTNFDLDPELEDRTPGHLIAAGVTEYGVVRPPYDDALASLWTRPAFGFVNRTPVASHE